MISHSAFCRGFLLVALIGIPAAGFAQTAAPPNATVYFISPKDGDTVTSPFKVQFGLSGMGVAPAGVEKRTSPMSAMCQERTHALQHDRRDA